MFTMDSTQLDNNVYEMIIEVNQNSNLRLKYVQVRKEKI